MNIQSIFSNKILIQICFGQYDMQLNFHDGLSIMVSDSLLIKVLDKETAVWTHESKNVNIEQVLKFLNKEVLEAKFDEVKGLFIKFSEGVFHIPKPDDDYEYLHVMSKEEGIYIY